LKREHNEEEEGYFTFEWVCRDLACVGEGQLHRKRISAQTLEKAKAIAKLLFIPDNARVIEEEERMLKMAIVW
jgi:hypothetical protein